MYENMDANFTQYEASNWCSLAISRLRFDCKHQRHGTTEAWWIVSWHRMRLLINGSAISHFLAFSRTVSHLLPIPCTPISAMASTDTSRHLSTIQQRVAHIRTKALALFCLSFQQGASMIPPAPRNASRAYRLPLRLPPLNCLRGSLVIMSGPRLLLAHSTGTTDSLHIASVSVCL